MPSLRSKAKLTLHFKGGPGSGHRGHAGRPGKRGGSVPGGGGYTRATGADKKWIDSLTEGELQALNGYMHAGGPVEAGAAHINTVLRDGNPSQEDMEYIRAIDSAIAKAPKAEGPTTLYRGERESDVLGGGAFISASRGPRIAGIYAERGKAVKRFTVPAGTPMAPVSAIHTPFSEEVLLPRDVKISDYDVVEKEHTSAIIAFSLENDDYIRKLSEKYGPNRVQPLHMTLLYMGRAVDSVARDSISERLRAFSNVYAPVDGVYNGWASFDDTGDGYPHVLLYDSPPLPFFRQRLAEAMDDIRPEQDHGFTPHTTLSYLDYQDRPNGIVNYPKTFDSLWLFWGDEKHEFPLIGDVVEKSIFDNTAKLTLHFKGGLGSGHRGHAGRPGKRGGSLPGVGGGLSLEQAARSYTENSPVNIGLREGKSLSELDPDDREIAEALDAGMKPIGEHITVYRAVGGVGTAEGMRRAYGTTSPKAGHTFADEGYASATTSFKTAFVHGGGREAPTDYWRIKLFPDNLALDLRGKGAWGAESEILLPRGSTFKKIGTTYLEKQDIVVVDIEIVEGSIVEKQLPIDEEGKQALLNLRIELFFDKSDALAERMYVGEISLGQWQEDMKSLIRNVHTSAAAIGRGGWDEMTWQDWGRLGTPMREQYRYLQGFAEVISEKRDVISLKAIQARARLYGEGAGGSAILMQTGAEIEGLLPYIPRDGSTPCLNRCHCRWLLNIADTLPDGRKVVQAMWRLGVAEHCNTCLSRDGHTEVITVTADTDVPRVIGGI